MRTLLEVCTGGPAASGTVEDEEEEKVEKEGIFFRVLDWVARLDPVGLGRGAAASAALRACLPRVSLKSCVTLFKFNKDRVLSM